ncbi:CotD family spore coat protein [Bacillus sp. JJ722]|uniref:CotD family spore coat protein n=1 Tax=Bacillus sp. JJ722 TaxID=3122973 RepID=UPI003F68B459
MYYQSDYGCHQPHFGACPTKHHTNVCPTQVMPTQVSPTQNIVNKNIYKHIVPHIHPTHTTTVNDHIYQNQHYFPHTQSVVNTCKSENVFCQQPMMCPPSPCHMPYGKFY